MSDDMDVEIELQLDSVNKKQARFISAQTREIEHPATYGRSEPRIELIHSAVVYLDREVWMGWGSPSVVKVML